MKQKLLNSFKLRATLLVAMLCAVCTGAWATDVTYTVTSTSAVSISGTAPTGSTASYSSTYGTACQLTKNNSMTLTLSGYEGYKITGITLSMKSNSKGGSGSLSVTAGDTDIATISDAAFNSASWNGAWSTSYVDINVSMVDNSYEIQDGENVVITIAATVNSLYCQSFTLTYESAAAPTKVATPAISGTQKFLTSTTVTISCATVGAAIQYTTDDGANWINYSTPFDITETTTVKAKATNDVLTDSDESDAVTFTKVTPITVTDALSAIAELGDNGTIDDQYVSGVVSTAGTSVSSGKMTYSISVDGTTTNELQIYQGKGLNNTNFSAVTDLEVGDRVVVYGQLKKYVNGQTTTPEFNSGSYLMSLVEIAESDLTMTGDINLSMASPSTTADATTCYTTSSSGAITYVSGDDAVATVSAAGVVTPVAAGSTTIIVSQAVSADYKAGVITINVIVAVASLNSTTITAKASGSTTYGTPKVENYGIDNTYDGTIAAVSSNTAVATVAITQHTSGAGTFTITPVAVGTATITISAPATATCEAADDVTYTITVDAPTGLTTAAPAPINIFEERFNAANGDGPSGDSWSGTQAGADFAADNDGWAADDKYAGDGCARFGKSKANGAATTPAISFDPSVTYTLTFRAGAWNGDGTTLTLSCDDGDAILGQTSFTMLNNAWIEYETTVKAASGSKLTFKTSSKRFFLDDVVVSSGTPIKATLNANGYATFCSEYPLDFTGVTDYSAWQVTDINSENVITFDEVTGSVKGGTGLLLKGENGTTGEITLTSADSENVLSDNKLYGTIAPTYVEDNMYYGLKGVEFVKVNAGTVPAGKALLPASAVNAAGGVKSFTFVFNGADGIQRVEKVSAEAAEGIFNLAGQRVSGAQKGIFIVNGKKVVK